MLCVDCGKKMDLEEQADALLEHEVLICDECMSIRRQEDNIELQASE